MSHQLTVLIPCKDEQREIAACIRSIEGLATEILVADSGSTDDTLAIVRQRGDCRIIHREYVDAGNFKNWAIPQASCEWVLAVDADERVTPELSGEIKQLLSSSPSQDAYHIYRDNYFMGHRVRYTSWGRDKVIRLFRRDLCRYREHTDHSEIDTAKCQTGILAGHLTHYTCWEYDNYLNKMHRYTEQQAEVWFQAGRRPSVFRLLCNGPLRFLRSYVMERGFLDGRAGFQVSALTGFYSFMKQARLWHKYHALKPEQIDAA